MTTTEGMSVARADLDSDSSFTHPSSPADADYLAKLATSFGDFHEQIADPGNTVNHCETDEAIEFRLFAKSGREDGEGAAIQRIALRSPTPVAENGGAVIRQRPSRYHFTGETTAEQAQQLQQAAVSGSEVLSGLKTKWPGCELPWRVIVVNVPSSPKIIRQCSSREEAISDRKKARKGKKTRIAIRKRLAKDKASQIIMAKERQDKSATEKEKRNRRNREKKLKKRQRLRGAKASSS